MLMSTAAPYHCQDASIELQGVGVTAGDRQLQPSFCLDQPDYVLFQILGYTSTGALTRVWWLTMMTIMSITTKISSFTGKHIHLRCSN